MLTLMFNLHLSLFFFSLSPLLLSFTSLPNLFGTSRTFGRRDLTRRCQVDTLRESESAAAGRKCERADPFITCCYAASTELTLRPPIRVFISEGNRCLHTFLPHIFGFCSVADLTDNYVEFLNKPVKTYFCSLWPRLFYIPWSA